MQPCHVFVEYSSLKWPPLVEVCAGINTADSLVVLTAICSLIVQTCLCFIWNVFARNFSRQNSENVRRSVVLPTLQGKKLEVRRQHEPLRLKSSFLRHQLHSAVEGSIGDGRYAGCCYFDSVKWQMFYWRPLIFQSTRTRCVGTKTLNCCIT